MCPWVARLACRVAPGSLTQLVCPAMSASGGTIPFLISHARANRCSISISMHCPCFRGLGRAWRQCAGRAIGAPVLVVQPDLARIGSQTDDKQHFWPKRKNASRAPQSAPLIPPSRERPADVFGLAGAQVDADFHFCCLSSDGGANPRDGAPMAPLAFRS